MSAIDKPDPPAPAPRRLRARRSFPTLRTVVALILREMVTTYGRNPGGYAWADTDNLGDDNGYFFGAGYEHMITQNVSLGGEVLYHKFDNFGTAGVDVDATTVQARAAFRF